MPISWNEIPPECHSLLLRLGGRRSEAAEKQTFWNEFYEDQAPINLKAVAIMDDLHDALEAGGYSGHELERFLVRVLFCLFAQCTGIFEREAFRLFIEDRRVHGTPGRPDGSDLGIHLAQLFAVLDTPENKRQTNLDETLAAFPVVNGELFAESLGFAAFNCPMRDSLLACTRFDWLQISPAIFGSLFQGTMKPKERRQLGSHYTSEATSSRSRVGCSSTIGRPSSNGSRATRTDSSSREIAAEHAQDPGCVELGLSQSEQQERQQSAARGSRQGICNKPQGVAVFPEQAAPSQGVITTLGNGLSIDCRRGRMVNDQVWPVLDIGPPREMLQEEIGPLVRSVGRPGAE